MSLSVLTHFTAWTGDTFPLIHFPVISSYCVTWLWRWKEISGTVIDSTRKRQSHVRPEPGRVWPQITHACLESPLPGWWAEWLAFWKERYWLAWIQSFLCVPTLHCFQVTWQASPPQQSASDLSHLKVMVTAKITHFVPISAKMVDQPRHVTHLKFACLVLYLSW